MLWTILGNALCALYVANLFWTVHLRNKAERDARARISHKPYKTNRRNYR